MNLIACMKRMGSCFKRTHYKKAFQIYFHVTVPNIKLSITMIIIIMIMIVFNKEKIKKWILKNFMILFELAF